MKLATLKNGTRDGRLVVVSKDLATCVDASTVAPTLQAALDDWENCEGALQDLSWQLTEGNVPVERFHEREAMSPLPRAYQWADGSAYVNHVELVRKARGAEMPDSFWTDPLIYQGGSDAFLGPRDPIPLGDEAWGCDFEGEVAVITACQGTWALIDAGSRSPVHALAATRSIGETSKRSIASQFGSPGSARWRSTLRS